MSRTLAELLGAEGPGFRLNLQQLEQAAGTPSADIRLTTHISNATKEKIRELGLDPIDTTGSELYAALKERFVDDEARVRESLGIAEDANAVDILARIKLFLERIDVANDAFVIKPAVMRRLLKKNQPKATMKQLGYRSLDSMLKHEPVPQLFAAAILSESTEWHKRLLESYGQLSSSDFETHPVSFFLPTTKRWPQLAARFVSEQKHNVLCIRELGAVVILPIEQNLPGLAITSLLLGFENINDIRSQSSFLKLQQVRPDFGQILKAAALTEPLTGVELGGRPLPWKIIQRFYGRGQQSYHPELFEPHVQPEDLSWHDAEDALATIHPALSFWQGGQMLALLDNGQPVSLNLLDVALAACNSLAYPDRIVHYMRESVWHELMSKYLHEENLEGLVLGKLNQQLLPEPAYEESPVN
ncbi:MAG: hypothetical protein WC498_01295 [Candidatus Saccharimonadales bacterium]